MMRPGNYLRISFALVACIAASGGAAAQASRGAPLHGDLPRYVVMTGEATISAPPDQAVISGGVVTDARKAGDALAENRQAMAQVYDALAQRGVPKQAIETSNVNLEPQHPPADPKSGEQSNEIIGYRVANEITVTLDDTSRAGAVLDALIESGANDFATVSFGIKDTDALLDKARAAAGKDALKRAQTYAESVGAQLGVVLAIHEGQDSFPSGGIETVMVTAEKRSETTPISPGQQSVSADVTIMWGLK